MSAQNKKNVLFIINPKAGTRPKNHIPKKIKAYFDIDKFAFSIKMTTHKGHASRMAHEATDKYDLIVACGGDGTVNEVAKAVIGTSAVLGIIPLGSGNGLARELGLSMSIRKSLEIIQNGRIKMIDVGRVNDLYFINSFSLGLTNDIAITFDKLGIRGLLGYSISLCKHLFNNKFTELQIENEGVTQKLKVRTFDIFNIAQFGYNFKFLPWVTPFDGQLHLLSFYQLNWFSAMGMLLKIKLGKTVLYKHSLRLAFDKITIRHSEDFAQIDGDCIRLEGSTLSVQCLPQKLAVIVPF